MPNEEFRCSRDYHEAWKKLINQRFSELERLEEAEKLAAMERANVKIILEEHLKDISDRRQKALDELSIAALECLHLPPDDRAVCQEEISERGNQITEALDAEKEKAQRDAEDERKIIDDKLNAARKRLQDRDVEIADDIKELGEKLATCIETIQGSNGISKVPAFGTPSELLPTIAFVGENYANAAKFYQQWNIPTHTVTSIEEFTDILANSGLAEITRIRFTCHSNVDGMAIAMFRNGPGYRQRFVVTPTELNNLMQGDKAYFAHLMFGGAVPLSPNGVQSVIVSLDPTAEFFKKLSLNTPTQLLQELIGWLFFANTSDRALKIRPQTFSAKRACLRAARLAADDLKQTAKSTGLDAQALDELDQAIGDILANAAQLGIEPFEYNNMTKRLADRIKAAETALNNNFRQTMQAARATMTKQTCLDLRGCLLAQLGNDFPAAISQFLSIQPELVNAPEWFTSVGQSFRPASIVSIECLGTLKKQSRRPYIRSYLRRWLRDLGFNDLAQEEPSFDRLVFYFHKIAPILPLLQISGTEVRPKSKLDIVNSLGFLCEPEEPREAMSMWVRSLWLDAPEQTVNDLVSSWLKNVPPFAEAIVEEIDLFDRDASGVAFPMTPSYRSHFLSG